MSSAQFRSTIKRVIPRSLAIYWICKAWRSNDVKEWPLPEFIQKQGIEKYEYSIFSQNGEDGILRYLFSEIGFSSRLFLEFGFGVTENNSLRLLIKEGFGGLFIDGSQSNVGYFNDAAEKFGLYNAKAIQKFLNLENLEPTIINNGTVGDIDLLSIDVDGNDYWFWERIESVNPRVVITEYNASFGPTLSCTVPYDAIFKRHEKHPSGFYCGASISALEKLGASKGYSLVGCDSSGVNAFFVRNDCVTRGMNVQTSESAYRPHKNRILRGFTLDDQFESIKNMPLINI